VTAERIASIVSNVKKGAYISTIDGRENYTIDGEVRSWAAAANDVVVDSTTIYKGLVARTDDVALYEDHPCIVPPWRYSTVCYENEHGNVVVMVGMASREDHWDEQWKVDDPEMDWDAVRWVMTTLVWCGGKGKNGPTPTFGPTIAFQYAIDDDGTPLDIHWVDFMAKRERRKPSTDRVPVEWDMALLVHLGTLNFMSARNVDIIEPTRPRPQQKRLARHGVRVHELRVFPTGRSSRSRGEGQPQTLASHGVRGHFAHYGACCPHHEPRGLLFGKLEGKFYVPQHVRGSKDVGEIKQEFVLVEDPVATEVADEVDSPS
jgi:hypothetical protein